MHTEFLMGNEAIALGAIDAGVNVAAGYPGTPSTEVLETIERKNDGSIYVEWSVNEKAGMEVAAGASMSGARSLVTMKQMGLNVSADPIMCMEYLGVKGGMVVLVADDPGPISSQTEQDTRTFAMFSKVPVLDPASVQEAYDMVIYAFELSEKYGTPVILRPTTRIDHGYASITVRDSVDRVKRDIEGFVKDSSKWVIFPKLSVVNHAKIEERNDELKHILSDYSGNFVMEAKGSCREEDSMGLKKGIVSQGASYSYVMDALMEDDHPAVMKVGTAFPFPEEMALSFMENIDEILVVEELDPVIERALIFVCGKHGIKKTIHGKLDGTVKPSGENTPKEVRSILQKFCGKDTVKKNDEYECEDTNKTGDKEPVPDLPKRPPVLCAGCPHRASFYAVKQAMRGEKTIYCGDIGCYTLGNAKPLDMCDTCLCMGAGINMAQGVWHVEPDTKAFAFVGDSTFFASGLTGVVNSFYNQADITLVILDNSTTAMTGHQPHPGTGDTAMGQVVDKVDTEALLHGVGIDTVETVNPLHLRESVDAVKRVSEKPGTKAIIFKYPCIVKFRPKGCSASVDVKKCVACRKCINDLGCPALTMKDGKAFVDDSLCTGCTLCQQVCPFDAISGGQAQNLNEEVELAQKKERENILSRQMDASLMAQKTADEMRKGPANKETTVHTPSNKEGICDVLVSTDSIKKNIILTGVGGQGIILASRLIAEAAMKKGIPVKTAETIGMAQRGGSVCSYVRLGHGAYSPLVSPKDADVIIGFEPAEALRMLPYLKKGGTVVTSGRPVIPVTASIGNDPYHVDEVIEYLKKHVDNLILLDVDKALCELGSDKVLNVLLLGAAAADDRLGVTREDIKDAIKSRMPEKLRELNYKALTYTVGK